MSKRLSWYAGLTALLAAVTLGAQAQPLTGGLLGRAGAYSALPAPVGCVATSVPFFGSDLKLTCGVFTDNPATGTISAPTVVAKNVTAAGLATPGAITVTPQGTGGVVTWTYKLVATLSDGTTTEAGAASSTAVGNANLTAGNFNRLAWSAVTGATGYKVYRTVAGTSPATVGIIYTGTALTVDDVGLVGDTTTAPTVDGTGVVRGDRVLVGDGSAAAPSVAFASAPTTGIHYGGGTVFLNIGGASTQQFGPSFVDLNADTAGIRIRAAHDTLITSPAAATLQLGAAAANADGVDQRLQTQGGITGTDRAAGDFDLTTGLGTGTGYSKVTISAPMRVGTGTTPQSRAVKATIDDTGVTANIGTGTATARVGGVLYVSTTAQATTGTSEEILATYTLPANTLSANGKAVRVTVTGYHAATTNSGTIRIRWGGISGDVLGNAASSTANAAFTLVGVAVRTGASTQVGGTVWGATTAGANGLSGTKDTTANIDIVVTGITATAAGDVTFTSMIVEALN